MWQGIDSVPKDKDVLLCWTFPDDDDIRPDIRIGRFFMKRYDGSLSFKLEMDCGDSGAWYFTPDNYVPTHWMELPEPPK